jgi:superfamily II DNA or RNA helicase
MNYQIKQLDPIESLMSRELFKEVSDLISYTAVFYQQSMYRKVRKEYRKTTKIGVTKDGVLFYTGLIPKIQEFCLKNKIDLTFEKHTPVANKISPKLPDGIVLRDFQKDLINLACTLERGILKAPTGTGKTILGLALLSSLSGLDGVLWLCHTKDLMYQTADEAKKFFGEKSVGTLGDGTAVTDRFITVATRQTFKDYADDLGTSYDVVIVDEAHHVTTFDGEYATILKKVFAPIRIGLTATLPTSQEALLAVQSFLGPLIGEMTINEGRELGFMARPVIKIIKIPESFRIKEIRKYTDVYEHGVVRRLERNRIIVDLIKKHHVIGDSVLVIVNKIAHGDLLLNMCQSSNVEAEFIHGSTDSETRGLTKEALNEKRMKCVIATAVWKEGVNIPELNVVINAAGGKSEIATLQSIGRGLRRTEEKSELIIYDFFDNSHHHIISHFGERFSLYCDMNWI